MDIKIREIEVGPNWTKRGKGFGLYNSDGSEILDHSGSHMTYATKEAASNAAKQVSRSQKADGGAVLNTRLDKKRRRAKG